MKHTPGPWRWNLNATSKTVRLESSTSGRDTVMDFTRYGMNWATPRFNIGGIMEKAEVIAVPVTGREHHKDWFQNINHPDAHLIAAAPDLLEALEKSCNFIKVFRSRHGDFIGKDWNDAVDAGVIEMESAIKKARGL